MANKTTRIDFNKERLYEALQMNGINSVRELCDENDSLCYGGNYVSRKTIERACQTGKVSVRTLEILSRALDCTPEFLMGIVVEVKDDEKLDQCIVYMSDNREIIVKGKNIYWFYEKDDNDKYVCRFYGDRMDENGEDYRCIIAEFCAAVCYGIVRVEV